MTGVWIGVAVAFVLGVFVHGAAVGTGPSLLLQAKRRLGFKDRVIFRCPRGRHSWRQAYGDERLHYGRWHCRECTAHTDAFPKRETS